MKSPIPNKKVLFDVGIAGPIAGVIVTIPVLFLGIARSRIVESAQITEADFYLGESLLFKLIAFLVKGNSVLGHDLEIGPLAYAGWIGLFVTALNLLPVGQLDGGHIIYSMLGKRAKYIHLAVIGAMGVLSLFYYYWAF